MLPKNTAGTTEVGPTCEIWVARPMVASAVSAYPSAAAMVFHTCSFAIWLSSRP